MVSTLRKKIFIGFGGSSTMVGDPPNVILGTYFQLTFMDFVKNTGFIALVGFVINTIFFILFYKKEILTTRKRFLEDPKWGRGTGQCAGSGWSRAGQMAL
jgi:Na+/H+ antiporter NhaD/arsenite permease-like protein